MLEKSLRVLLTFFCAALLLGSVSAQETKEDYEPAANSSVTSAKLPTGAVRVAPGSVPTEINQGLEKIVEAGEGKLVEGEREILAWTENGYTKAKAADVIAQLENNLSASGWKYEVGGREGDVTFFTIFKENPKRRAVVGFFVASDDGLLVAWTEVLQANSSIENKTESETKETVLASNAETIESLRDPVGKKYYYRRAE